MYIEGSLKLFTALEQFTVVLDPRAYVAIHDEEVRNESVDGQQSVSRLIEFHDKVPKDLKSTLGVKGVLHMVFDILSREVTQLCLAGLSYASILSTFSESRVVRCITR
jgi:hypothetical protein